MKLLTASWFSQLPEGSIKIGISRGVPRRQPAGYRMLHELQPGPWFTSIDVDQYRRRYQQILDQLDPAAIVGKIEELAAGRSPVLCCFERPDHKSWCHRAFAAAWLGAYLKRVVPEFGFEQLPQADHPLMPRRCAAQATALHAQRTLQVR
ncbi:hypothetical protein [Dongia deserti]|uniref:hypothetical protein n=1 Tax=Dongia deserti TaxID=2268030 RepID=UPI000E65B179|nr:hypothetical protein [Dongia deserti]